MTDELETHDARVLPERLVSLVLWAQGVERPDHRELRPSS
jgi:hypothetical protein